MATLEPYEENKTALIAVSSIMLVFVLLSLPLVFLYEMGEIWFKKKRGHHRTVPVSSIASISSTENPSKTLLTPFDSIEDVERVKVVNVLIQCDDCELRNNRDNGQGEKPAVKKYVNKRAIAIHKKHQVKQLPPEESCSTLAVESSSLFDTSTTDFAIQCNNCCYMKHPIIKNQESCMCVSTSPDETDEGTQTSTYDFDISRDCILISEEESEKARIITAEPSRFVPVQSKPRLIDSNSNQPSQIQVNVRNIRITQSEPRQVLQLEQAEPTTLVKPIDLEPDKPPPPPPPEPVMQAVPQPQPKKMGRPLRYQPEISNNRILCSGRLKGCSCEKKPSDCNIINDCLCHDRNSCSDSSTSKECTSKFS